MKTHLAVTMAALILTTACGGSAPTAPSVDNNTSERLPSNAAVVPLQSGLYQQLQGPKQQKITSGTMSTAVSSLTGYMTLSGARFAISGQWPDGGSTGCQPCGSGSASIWTSAAFTGSQVSATVDGAYYESVYITGAIKLAGTANIPNSEAANFTVVFPFVVDDSSSLIGYRTNPDIGPAVDLFRLDLRGRGTASLQLTTVAVPGARTVYTADSLVYTF